MASRGRTLYARARIAVLAVSGLVFHVARRIAMMPRLRRFLRRAFLASAAVLTVSLLASAWLTHRSTGELETMLAELKAKGEPVSCVELAPPPVPADENAAVLYNQAFALFVKPDDDGPADKAIDALMTDKTGKIAGREALEKYLAQNGECLAKVSLGSERPRCRYDVDYSQGFYMLLPHLLPTKEIARLERIRAQLDAEAGRPDKALETLATGAKLAHGLEEEPLLISQLVRIACENSLAGGLEWVLAHSEPGPAACRSLLETLDATAPRDETYVRTLVGERCFGLYAFALLRDKPSEFKEIESPAIVRALIPGWFVARDEMAYLAIMGRTVDRARTSRLEPFSPSSKFEEEARALPWHLAITKMMLPALGRVEQVVREGDARRAVARVSLALRIHRLERGSYPEKLEELVPAILPVLPRDPFTLGSLRYERDGSGFKVWSLGPDLKDQGGATKYDLTPAQGPIGDDISFRVGR